MKLRIALVLISSLVVAGCDKKEEDALPPPPKPKAKEFAIPSDGLLQPERAARWRQADSLVRLIDSAFEDSLRNSPDRASLLTAQQDAARDLAARKAGLLGWKEYRWVLDEASRNPANAAAFEAAGLSMAVPAPATKK